MVVVVVGGIVVGAGVSGTVEDTAAAAWGGSDVLELDGDVRPEHATRTRPHPRITRSRKGRITRPGYRTRWETDGLDVRLGQPSRLDEFSGSEVKHTGDGVLVSFTSVTKALKAAAGMHRASAEIENLRIKIGLSTGEAVEELSDIYGAAMNPAARICAHAAGGQTFVAGTVRDLAMGKGFGFSDIGEIELKGFPEPVRLFSVQPSCGPSSDHRIPG